MISKKNLDARYIEVHTPTSRLLKRVQTGLVISTISNGFPCYNYSNNRIIGVNEQEQFFVVDTTTDQVTVFETPILDYDDLGDGLVQLQYQTHCSILDILDIMFIEFECMDVDKTNDPKTLVVNTTDSVLIIDRQTRRIKLKTARI
jgi:hypothetical protein